MTELVSSEIWNDCFLETIGENVFSEEPAEPDSDKDNSLLSNFNVTLDDQSTLELSLESCRSTTRELVGLQLWRGGLLLADFICSYPHLFKGQNVLELAAGTGFTSLVASQWADHVICTDIDVGEILTLIKSNCQRNQNKVKSSKFLVEELNFFKSDWKSKLENELSNLDIILVADVVYNEEITKAFFQVLNYLQQKIMRDFYVLIAMERRVWTNNNGELIAPSHDVFMTCLDKLEESCLHCEIESIPLEFPHHFCHYYQRVEELLMWKISFKSSSINSS